MTGFFFYIINYSTIVTVLNTFLSKTTKIFEIKRVFIFKKTFVFLPGVLKLLLVCKKAEKTEIWIFFFQIFGKRK